ncbi:MAG: family 78 glycoside hydrolase catalytic domain [Limnochordia bacterium]
MQRGSIVPTRLRCEYAENPIGLDAIHPRLSWELMSEKRDQMQSAYQILVASSEESLISGVGDLWDSGKVESSKTAQIVYEGKPLESRQRCYWQVRVWDAAGNVGDYSERAYWEMGLLTPEDYRGQWIGFDTRQGRPELTLDGCHWMWRSGDDQAPNRGFFRRQLTVSPGAEVESAWFLLTADNSLQLYVNGRFVGRGSGAWTAVQYMNLAPYLREGANVLAISAIRRRSDSAGLIGRLCVAYTNGQTEWVDIDASWRAVSEETAGWQELSFDDSPWPAAVARAPYKGTVNIKECPAPAPYMRREFAAQSGIRQARLYSTALGVYEMRLNGRRVGADQLRPGWTDYRRRLQVQAYDVTDLIDEGANLWGVILGDGWYTGYVGGFGRGRYGDYPLAFLGQLHIEYEDGTSQVIATDSQWRAASGPIITSDLLMGEIYDSRLEMPGWDETCFGDDDWHPVAVVEKETPELVAAQAPPIQITEEVRPIALDEPLPGTFVFDLGQNMVGKYRLRVQGPRGSRIFLRFAEMLNDDGTIYTENLRSARQTDVYILKGEGVEEYIPFFTFHGFRYVEVTGFPGKPTLDSLTGLVMHNALDPVGTFTCSDEMVNQLQSNIVWGARGNFVSTPTDCPQRDERCGWTGDAQVFVRTACANMDAASFFAKYMNAVEDGQADTGAFPHVAPAVEEYRFGSPAWGDAGVIVPWTVYLCYGDTTILAKHYEAMKRWIAYLKENSQDLVRPAEGYGDWLSVAADTPKEVISTAYFAYSTKLLSKIAQVLGRDDDSRHYEGLFGKIKAAFNKAFVAPDGRIHGDTQTCYLLALHMDLLPERLRQAAAQHLVRAIEEKDWHLSTGFLGVGLLLPILSDIGRTDIAYRLLHNETYPSWIYSIHQGATTIWERWNSYTKEHGFGDAGMNSFNHYSLGSVGEWFYRYVAGIEIDEEYPGYERFIIRPQPGGRLQWARTEYHSIRGPIAVHWELKDDALNLDIRVPANTVANVHVPLGEEQTLTESGSTLISGGSPVSKTFDGVRDVQIVDGSAVLEVGSGEYSFVAR